MTKDETKANEEVIAKNGVKAMLFDDVQKLILRHYDELFPNYEWMDYMESLGLMAAEVKVLRCELLDACRLATDFRGVLRAARGRKRDESEQKLWEKLSARLEALILEIRARWYAAAEFPNCQSDIDEKPSYQPEPDIAPNILSLQQKELGVILDAKTKDIEDSGTCEGYSRVDPLRIAAEVRERRAEQDKQWGGPKHDDEHFPADWVRYIRKAARQAMTREAPNEAEGFEDYMLDVAALAVAAIESSRRKRGERVEDLRGANGTV